MDFPAAKEGEYLRTLNIPTVAEDIDVDYWSGLCTRLRLLLLLASQANMDVAVRVERMKEELRVPVSQEDLFGRGLQYRLRVLLRL